MYRPQLRLNTLNNLNDGVVCGTLGALISSFTRQSHLIVKSDLIYFEFTLQCTYKCM